MKKIDANYELFKIKNKSKIGNNKSFKSFFITCFFFFFSVLALFGVSYSNKIFNKEYKVSINILNGYEDNYFNVVGEGYFEDTLYNPNANVKSISCVSGNISYDKDNFKIYSDNVEEDIDCTIEFEYDVPDGLDISKLEKVSDNFGLSYLFNKDMNNYIVFNDMLFRIIRINGDGSLRIMLNDSIGQFNNKDINLVLNDWINQFIDNNYIVYSSYDNYDLSEFNKSLVNIDLYDFNNVGLLSVNELLLYGIEFDNMMLSNKYYDKYWSVFNYNIQVVDESVLLDIRPVINIKIDKLDGLGTKELPYVIVK